jgi:hypothetical protein
MMEEEKDDKWRQQQFIEMFMWSNMWSNPVVYEKLL